jgi:hypothetical protein
VCWTLLDAGRAGSHAALSRAGHLTAARVEARIMAGRTDELKTYC